MCSEPVAEVRDFVLPGDSRADRRAYVSAGRPPPAAVLAYFFGGGWVLGSLETAEPVFPRRLANAAECAGRLDRLPAGAQDPSTPAAVEDCYAATCWLAEHGGEHGLDATRLAVAAQARRQSRRRGRTLARDRGGPPLAFQLLVYPPLDHRAATPSRREPVECPFFGPEDVAWCWSHYLADPADGESPLASPLCAGDLRRVATRRW